MKPLPASQKEAYSPFTKCYLDIKREPITREQYDALSKQPIKETFTIDRELFWKG